MDNIDPKDLEDIPDKCPHCGQPLSPWQQVLLNIDRALTCKNCWYRIILDPPVEEEEPDKNNNDNSNVEE